MTNLVLKLALAALLTTAVAAQAQVQGGGSTKGNPLSRLRPGEYASVKVGCAGLGGGGSASFDGRNLSGHYQVCKTTPIPGSANRYLQRCLEGQGANNHTLADIDTNPNASDDQQTIIVNSPTNFTIDGEQYAFCGGSP